MIKPHSQILFRFAYPILLTVTSCYILVIFLRPIENVHEGINFYYRSKFLDMVNGTAYKPFVYRTLLPTTVRLISSMTPNQYRHAFNEIAGEQYSALFKNFGWETSAAYEYNIALILMLVSFMGFAHYGAKLVMLTCKLEETPIARGLLVFSILLCLPPFFKYTSFPYDPPQMFLFTMALYLLATSRYRNFIFVFIACCINKETAILLILLYAIIGYKKFSSPWHYWGILFGLIGGYAGIKFLFTLGFRSNPGSFVELQFFHNVDLLTRGWTFTNVSVISIVILLLFYQWKEKPIFLKVSFLCIFPPLIIMTLFLGFIDEWRGYYEAYPIAFGLIVDSLLRIKSALDRNHNTV